MGMGCWASLLAPSFCEVCVDRQEGGFRIICEPEPATVKQFTRRSLTYSNLQDRTLGNWVLNI